MGFQRTTISLVRSFFFFFGSVRTFKSNYAIILQFSSPAMLPSMVVYPSPTENVVEFVRIATIYKFPITVPTGATNLDGHYHDVRTTYGSIWLRYLINFIANSMSSYG
jgi:hypothetical protein